MLQSIFIFQEDVKKPKITKRFFIPGKSKTGEGVVNNSCVTIEGYDCSFRHRAEIIILNKGKVFCQIKKDGTVKLPGGGLEKHETAKEAAIREAKEESYINTKNVNYAGYEIIYPLEPKDWEIRAVGFENVWRGRYTEIFIGQYDSKFKGKVAEVDKDDLVDKGDWYSISKILPLLSKAESEALKKFL